MAPPKTATVVSPRAHTVTAHELAALSRSTSKTLVFEGDRAFHVGDILVAGPTRRLPQGLLRRVVGVEHAAGTTKLATVPGRLTDVFEQLDVESHGPVGGTPGHVRSRPRANGTISLPLGSWSAGATAKDGKASVSYSLEASQTLIASADLELKIDTAWSYGIPHPSVEKFHAELSGSLPTSITGSATVTGALDKQIALSKPIAVDEIPVSEVPPIAIVVNVTPMLVLEASGSISENLGYTFTPTFDTGLDYQNGKLTPFGSFTSTGKWTTPATPHEGLTASVGLSAAIAPKISLDADDAVGPDDEVQAGVERKLTYPCLGSDATNLFVQDTFGGELAFLGVTLKSVSVTLAKYSYPLRQSAAPGCADVPTATGTLPVGAVGSPYHAQFEGKNGKDPYAFHVAGLPSGLYSTLTGQISGSPTVAGTFTVDVTTTDAYGVTGPPQPLTLTIQPPPSARTTTVDNPGPQSNAVGDEIDLPISATDGTSDPLTYQATGLPPGLQIDPSSGVISGTPSDVGHSTVTVTATNTGNKSAHATFAWTIGPPGSTDATYAGAVMRDQPSLYWRLDDAAGSTTATDSSGYGRDGRYSGLTADPMSGALVGDSDPGSSVKVNADPGSFEGLGAATTGASVGGANTIEFWMQALPGDNYPFWLTDGAGGDGELYNTAIDVDTSASGRLVMHFWDGEKHEAGNFVLPPTDGAWHLYDVTARAGRATVYQDGAPIATVFDFGGFSSGPMMVEGKLDEVAVYPGGLPAGRIAAHWAVANNLGSTCGTPGHGSYATSVLAQAPAVYYRLDDTTRVLLDSSGHCRNAARENYASSPAGAIAGDAAMTASLTAAVAPAGSLPSGSAPRTVEMWYRAPDLTTNNRYLMWYGPPFDSGSPSFGALLATNSTAMTLSVSTDQPSNNRATFPLPFRDTNWHMYDIVYDGTQVTVYADGQAIGSSPLAVDSVTDGAQLNLGGGATGNGTGTYDEFAMYPSALTAANIHARYIASAAH